MKNPSKITKMHQALWALAVAITESRGRESESLDLIPVSNRVALRLAPRGYAQPQGAFLPEVSWLHICHPRKYYNRLKRAYLTVFPRRMELMTHPVKIKVTNNVNGAFGREIKINNRKCNTLSLFSATADNLSYNLATHKGCTNCGKKLTPAERIHIQLAVIARRAQ